MLLNNAIEQYKPKHIIALFSGGHDSLAATHLAISEIPGVQIAHLNTGIGIDETHDFVRETCDGWKKPLLEYHAAEYIRQDGQPDPQVYAELVKERGFPGPGQHNKMYCRLKERPLRHLIRKLDRDRKDITMLITGVRRHESQRRMRHVEPIQKWEGTKLWVAPIWDFTMRDVNRYIEENGLRRNIVSDLLHGSKECLCGAFAHPGEFNEIETWYPKAAQEIRELEAEVHAAGFPWNWGEGPPSWFQKIKAGFLPLPGFESVGEGMLCATCQHR